MQKPLECRWSFYQMTFEIARSFPEMMEYQPSWAIFFFFFTNPDSMILGRTVRSLEFAQIYSIYGWILKIWACSPKSSIFFKGCSTIISTFSTIHVGVSPWLWKPSHLTIGWWYTYPSEKYEFVCWDDDIPNIWKVIKIMFQTTNQTTIENGKSPFSIGKYFYGHFQ